MSKENKNKNDGQNRCRRCHIRTQKKDRFIKRDMEIYTIKKFLIVIAIILAVVILILCASCTVSYLNRYKDWQEIDVPEVGRFKIPPDWAYHRDGNRIYLTDKSVTTPTQENTYIVGTVKFTMNDEEACQVFDSNAKYVDTNSGIVLSNSAYIRKIEYIIHEKLCTKVSVEMWASSDAEIDMLVWDDSIEYELAKKIAKSYAMHLKEDK